jgi:hypothetical protein
MCIKPLMDEEALENGFAMQQAQAGAPGGGIMSGLGIPMGGGMHMQQPFAYQVSGPDGYPMQMQPAPMHMGLPRALLNQYPALGGIWNSLPADGGSEDIDDGNMAGRGSFSSAGGDYEDDEWSGNNGQAIGWASDVGP